MKIYNQNAEVVAPTGFPNIHVSQSSSEFSIQNARVTASFNSVGLLKAIKIGPYTVPVHLDFAKYGVRQAAERSGAYLFLPDGDAVPLKTENTIVKIVQGIVFSSVQVQIPYIHHTVYLYNTPGKIQPNQSFNQIISFAGADGLGLEIHNVVDIANTNNFEIVMRFSTNINSTDEFFTDINGHQVSC